MTRSSAAPVQEGDLLAGKYRVERVLGAGGMGVVVAARHEQLDQLVAIKFVRDDALENEEAVHRFLREARAAVKLKSEHVARVLDVGKLESGAPYMVMEFLEGNDLARVLGDQGPLPVEPSVDWILQACEAVAEAHAAGIVHRDLKPENLFLTRTVGGAPKVKVLDFGVSKAMGGKSGDLSGLTRTRAMLGSPLYMAPEQMRSSRDVNPAADVWALGVVLFQMLTTQWPFEAETMPELCLKVVTEPPQSLALLRPDVPAPLVAVIERCLEKDPTLRYANAAELASALEPFGPPASRLFAERARMAIGSGTAVYESMPRIVARGGSGPTLPSGGSSGSRPSAVGSGGRSGAAPFSAQSGAGPSGPNTPMPGTPMPGTPMPGTPMPGTPLPLTPMPASPIPHTSAGWGTERNAVPPTLPSGASRGAGVKIGIGVAAVVAIGVVVLALRSSAPAPAPVNDPVAPVTARPPPAPDPLPVVLPAPSATNAAPEPVASAMPSSAVEALPSAKAHPESPRPDSTKPVAAPARSAPSARPQAPPRPGNPDDDIPTIR
jgi:serine/threonine-protein kinase